MMHDIDTFEARAHTLNGVRWSGRRVARKIFTWRVLVWVWFLLVVGAAIGFTFIGGSYYRLPFSDRDMHPLDDVLRSRGILGHALGLIGTLMILANFSYLLRKQRKIFRSGPLDRWLDIHMLTGLTAWVVLTFHSSFHISRVLAVAYYGLFLVVFTGVVGRYVYAHIPKRMGGYIVSLRHLHEEFNQLSSELKSAGAPYETILSIVDASHYIGVIRGRKGFRLLPRLVLVDLRHFRILWSVRRFLKHQYRREPEEFQHIWTLVRRMARDAYWIAIIKAVQNLMAKWRVLHRSVAWLLVVLFFCHMVLVYLFLGREVFIQLLKHALPLI